jgi:transposase, IS5 family
VSRLNRARERLVRLTKKLDVSLRQSYARVGKLALIKHQRYAHAHQFKRATRSLRKLKTYLGRVIRDIERRIVGNEDCGKRSYGRCSWPGGACWSRSAASAAARSIPCTRQRSSASARQSATNSVRSKYFMPAMTARLKRPSRSFRKGPTAY